MYDKKWNEEEKKYHNLKNNENVKRKNGKNSILFW